MDKDKKFTIKGLSEFQDAIKKNPSIITEELAKFFTRSLAKLESTINNNPWRVGMSGGGVPVKTGNLRDTHLTTRGKFEATIKPSAPYAQAVHSGRPWLNYALSQNEREMVDLQKEMLKQITYKLAQ